MRPIRCLLLISALLLVFTVFLPTGAFAILVILPPDQMIEKSDVILTGKIEQVKSAKEKREGQEAVIRIDRVLKQPESLDIEPYRKNGLTVKEFIYTTGAVIQAIPPAGTEVMVFLQVSGGELSFTSDSNNIAVMQNNRVTESYRGINSNESPYAEAYNKFLEDHPRGAEEGKSLEDNGAGEASSDVQSPRKPWNLYAAAAAGPVLIGLGVWLGVKRVRRCGTQ